MNEEGSYQGESHANHHNSQVKFLTITNKPTYASNNVELDDLGVEKKERKMGVSTGNVAQVKNSEGTNVVTHFFGVGPGYQAYQDQWLF